MSRHHRRFPNESSEYRAARDDLLDLEVGLREQIERVAKARRALPVGGALPEDYEFRQLDRSGRVQPVRLSELFTPASDTLLLYSFMFGHEMEKHCPACTSLIDGFNGLAWHILYRLKRHITGRGDHQLRFLKIDLGAGILEVIEHKPTRALGSLSTYLTE